MAITVIGEHLAQVGLRFSYAGETDAGCKACKLHKQCHSNLKVGREYTITAVRPVQHDVCHVFEGKVQLVDLEPTPAPLRVAIPVAATRGTGFTKHWDECGASCLLKQHCNNAALKEGEPTQIERVEGDVPCLVGRKLKFALVRPDHG